MRRTFFFNVKGSPDYGSGFVVDVDGRQYFITAAHVIQFRPTGSLTLEVMHTRAAPESVGATIVGTELPPKADIAVLVLDRMLIDSTPIVLEDKGAYVSEQLYILGFPLGILTDGSKINGDFPIPLVKGAMVAGFVTDPDGGLTGYYLDAMNNHGFSGGPVTTGGSPPRVIGVVSSYVVDRFPVVDPAGHPSGLASGNSGIMKAYSIGYATQIIRKNPIGFKPAS